MKHYELDYFMNKPLNLAHFYERKAEKFMEMFEWEKTKEYYNKAADCISQAIEKTNSTNIRQSLQMQFDSYNNQARVIEIKRQEHEIELKSVKIRKKANHPLVENKNKPEIALNLPESGCGLIHDREPDSLLQVLKFLSTGDNPIIEKDRTIGHHKKNPKLTKDVIEELETKNQTLRNWVKHLLEEKEVMAEKYRKLKKENDALQSDLNYFYSNLNEVEDKTCGLSLGLTETEPQSYFQFENNTHPQQFKESDSKMWDT